MLNLSQKAPEGTRLQRAVSEPRYGKRTTTNRQYLATQIGTREVAREDLERVGERP